MSERCQVARECPHCGKKINVSISLSKSASEGSYRKVNVETAKLMIERGVPLEDMAIAFQLPPEDVMKVLNEYGVKV